MYNQIFFYRSYQQNIQLLTNTTNNPMTHFLSLEQAASTQSSYHPTQHQERALEYRASSSLCELSDYICADVSTQRDGEAVARERVNCSPWREKRDELRLQQFLQKMRKKSATRPVNDQSKILKGLCSREQGETTNQEIFKPRYARNQKEDTELKKFPSVFIRLMAAKQSKTQPKDNSQLEMLTILKRKKDCTHSQIKKAVLAERQDNNYSIQVRRSQAAQGQHANHCSTVKHTSLKQQQAQGSIPLLCEQKLVNDSWKIKNIYSKSKSIKRSSLGGGGGDNKQNVILPKKYHQEYQSRNPLTKLLYEKYVNTISMTHPIKEGRYK